MEKKKTVWLWVILIIVVVVLIGILVWRGKGKESIFVTPKKPINTTMNLATVLEDIQAEITGEANQKEELQDEWSEENELEEPLPEEEPPKAEDETILDFGEYEYLEKKAIVYTTQESINEVWLVKLTSYDEQEAIARLFGNRIRKLKSAFQGDAK